MTFQSMNVTVQTLDGLRLAATLDVPDTTPQHAALLVHGGGVTREEGGFFTRLSAGLATAGVATLRVDLPGHGESEGRQEDLSLSAILNVIRSSLDYLRSNIAPVPMSLLAASFSGGTAAYYAAKSSNELSRLILINPLIDYKKRFIDDKSAWIDDYINDESGRQLFEHGYVGHSPSLKLGRPILNEVFWLKPRTVLPEITTPTLLIHGTEDTFIPVESSRRIAEQLTCEHKLIELDGAQHGVAVHDDPEYADPQTQAWQAEIITAVANWITTDL